MAWTTPANMAVGDLVSAACYNATNVANQQYLKGQAGSVYIENSLGIGASSAPNRLHVENSASEVAIRIQRAGTGGREFYLAAGSTVSGMSVTTGDINFSTGIADGTYPLSSGSQRLRIVSTGQILINSDSSNTKMTYGLTINQGAADNEAIALKSSDVSHIVTVQAESDTYGSLTKYNATNGGLSVRGLADGGTVGIQLIGYAPCPVSTRSLASLGAVAISGWDDDGVSDITSVGTNNNVMVVQDGLNTVFIFDNEGDLHCDAAVSSSAYDRFDDALLLRALDVHTSDPATIIDNGFRDWARYDPAALERARLVTFNPDGHHFWNVTRTLKATMGAIWQGYERQGELEGENAYLRSALDYLMRELSVRTGCAFNLPPMDRAAGSLPASASRVVQ